MTVIGLDLSVTATGIAYADGSTITIKGGTGDARLVKLYEAVREALDPDTQLVVVEDLPRGAMGGSVTGMAQGVVRLLLRQTGVPYALVTPGTLKTFATGKGNAGKPDMAVAAYKRAGLEFGDDNQCDAWWLRAAGMTHLGFVVADLPRAQIRALDKVAWPVTA